MTARDVLAEIEQRMVSDDPHAWVSAEWAMQDRTRLVAALRAVLDLHQPVLHQPGHGCAPTIWCSASDGQLYPCATVRAITEALGGGA